MKTVIAMCCIAALSGCAATFQTRDTTNAKLASAFVGRKLDAFATRYGIPQSSMRMSDGGSLYEWKSDVALHQSASQTTVTTFATGNMATSVGSTTGGRVSAMFCVLRITTSADNTITAIQVSQDTIGYMALSRCAEVL